MRRRHAGRWVGRLAAMSCMAAALSACVQAAPDPSGNATAVTAAQQARQSLAQAIGEAPCQRDAQCHTVAVGAKACGGPEAYLPWSSQTADAARIQALADLYTQAQTAGVPAGRMSTCSVVTDPGAACVQQRCVLRTGLALK